MPTRSFEATTRIPTRPLSYANKDMAYNKELMVDYTNGNIYVKDENGTIHDITQAVVNIIKEDPDIDLGGNIEITIPNPDGEGDVNVTITAAISDLVNKIKEQQQKIDSMETTIEGLGDLATDVDKIQSAIDAITGGEGSGTGTVIQIKPGDIITDETHQFVTNTQLTEIKSKISLKYVTVTLSSAGWTGSAAPYTQTVTCTGATADMARPTIDIDHSSENYDTAMDSEDAWCSIYRAVTGADQITFYASEKPTVNLSVVVEMKLTGLTGV